MNGVDRIAAERRRQVIEEGWTPAHDDTHRHAMLAIAAGALAVDGTDAHLGDCDADAEDPWGLVSKHRGDRIRQLEIAGALIAAEIDRLLRLQPEPCVIGKFCHRHGFVHGGEAEELRERISSTRIPHGGAALRRILDEVDARDSLAFLEAKTAVGR